MAVSSGVHGPQDRALLLGKKAHFPLRIGFKTLIFPITFKHYEDSFLWIMLQHYQVTNLKGLFAFVFEKICAF